MWSVDCSITKRISTTEQRLSWSRQYKRINISNVKMQSSEDWKMASSPNYSAGVNVDKLFPYSEVPYIGQYKLMKIPQDSLFIDLVDYWGEGKIKSAEGVSGFTDCYNVNHSHQCVSTGPDRNKKIPNRIPVESYTICDTSSYIKENSVRTVTHMGAPINRSSAKDIVRMVNKTEGKIVIFGIKRASSDIGNLEKELEIFNFIYCPEYVLPHQLNCITLYDSVKNPSMMKERLRQYIISGAYDSAVDHSKTLALSSYSDIISEVTNQLLEENNKNVLNLAFKLWNGDAQSVVIKHFPCVFQAIFSEDFITIINKKYSLALKLDVNLDGNSDRMAWGDNNDKSSKRVIWKLIPDWKNNRVIFKLLNHDCGMFLKLALGKSNGNDREAWGSYWCPDLRHMWYLDPVVLKGELLFFIINGEYEMGLKLAESKDDYGDRQLWGHSTDIHGDAGCFGWYINSTTK